VDIFFNFFSTNDSVLLTSKKLGKLENPIGLVGAINLTKNIPINFHEKDVTAELTDCSNINKKTKQNRSDHGIYCGVVDEFANLINDGVVPIMVDNWRKQESSNTN
jgi:DNA phosphorothioation-dependent restriction protein DptG